MKELAWSIQSSVLEKMPFCYAGYGDTNFLSKRLRQQGNAAVAPYPKLTRIDTCTIEATFKEGDEGRSEQCTTDEGGEASPQGDSASESESGESDTRVIWDDEGGAGDGDDGFNV